MNVHEMRALCARAMAADRVTHAGWDISIRQLALLCELDATLPRPGTVRGLAARLCVGKPAITRGCTTLMKTGYIRRQRDPKDGRNVLISLTEKGKAFLNSLASEEGRVAA